MGHRKKEGINCFAEPYCARSEEIREVRTHPVQLGQDHVGKKADAVDATPMRVRK